MKLSGKFRQEGENRQKKARDRRITREVRQIMAEEAKRGIGNPPLAKKPGLDYYDNRRETRRDGSKVHYQGRFGKFEKD